MSKSCEFCGEECKDKLYIQDTKTGPAKLCCNDCWNKPDPHQKV